jgi:sugar lactone lactonase YvrE
MKIMQNAGLFLSMLSLVTSACAADAKPTASHFKAAKPEWVVQLNPTRGELPEGIAMDPSGRWAYLGLAPTGQVLRVDTATGEAIPFGAVPEVPPGGAYLLGLAFSADGELFAGVASSSDYPAGIYRFPKGGGAASLFASHEALHFPNGLVFDETGALFVTDSLGGAIFRMNEAGEIREWARDAKLRGDLAGPCANGAAFPIGANGLALSGGEVFVVNTDMGSMLRIPVLSDGDAGQVETFVKSNCEVLGGADGMVVSKTGTFLVAANAIQAITQIDPKGHAKILSQKDEFDFPASPALVELEGQATLFVTNAALKSAQMEGGAPRPGLLRIPLEMK